MRESAIVSIIRRMTPAEKTYFKKFGFKRDNKNNRNYFELLAILDNDNSIDITTIKMSKKLSSDFKKHLHGNISRLQGLLVASLVEYRDSKGKFVIQNLYKEFKMFKELKLYDLAKATLEKIIKIIEVEGYNPYALMVHDNYLNLMRNNLSVERNILLKQIDRLKKSLNQSNLKININLLGYGIEQLSHNNGGIVLTSEKDKEQAKDLLQQGKSYLEDASSEFVFLGSLINNSLILQLMIEEFEGFDEMVTYYLSSFDRNISKFHGMNQIRDTAVVLKNMMTLSIYFLSDSKTMEIQEKLLFLEGNATNVKTREFVSSRRHQTLILRAAIKGLDAPEESVKYCLNHLKVVALESAVDAELTITMMIVLLRERKEELALDLGNQFVIHKYNNRAKDELILTKILIGVAWYKLENIELSDSYFRTSYRAVQKHPKFTLAQQLLKLFKVVSGGKVPRKKMFIETRNILKDVVEDGTGLERMRAKMLLRIGELAFGNGSSN